MRRGFLLFMAWACALPFCAAGAPVQVATEAFVRSGLATRAKTADLMAIAFSGSYNDLTDRPALNYYTKQESDAGLAAHDAAETAHAGKFGDYRAAADQDAIDAAKMDKAGGTFTGEIFIPSKTAAPGNSGTKVATEAQVYGLLDRKATTTSLGMVKVGNGLAVDSNGLLTNTGIQTVYDWGTSIPIVGEVWTDTAIPSASLASAPNVPGEITYPRVGDKIYGGNGAQVLVTELHVSSSGGDAVRGTIIVGPPATASWGGINGQMSNNSAVPALTRDGGTTVPLIKIDASDKVQVGGQLFEANVNSAGRMTNNGSAVAYRDEIAGVRGDVDAEIASREAADAVVQANVEAEAARAGAAESALQASIGAIIDDSAPDSYSSTLSANKILSAITQAYTPIPDVGSPEDLPEEALLGSPSICFVNSTGTSWINTKTGNGWKNSGGNYATMGEVATYLGDNGYIRKAQVANNLTTASAEVPLSAAQGKWLMENKLTANQTVDNLTSGSATNPLSANMGKTLRGQIAAIEEKFTGGKASGAVVADTAATAEKLANARTITVNMSGYASGSGSVSFDGANNATINIPTSGATSGGYSAEGKLGVPNFGTAGGWIKLGTFTLGYSGSFRLCWNFGMTGTKGCVHLGTRSGSHTSSGGGVTLLNEQLRNYESGNYQFGLRVYSTNGYPASTYMVFILAPSYPGGDLQYQISAESGATLPQWSTATRTASITALTDQTWEHFPSASAYPVYWSYGGNNTNLATQPIGYTTTTQTTGRTWWTANPKS